MIRAPKYDHSWTGRGKESKFIEQFKQLASSTTEDWRDLNLDTKIAKHNMRFAETAVEKIEARMKWEVLEGGLKIAQLRKWRVIDDLKEHKDKARVLKIEKRAEVERMRSTAVIERAVALRNRQRGRLNMRARGDAGGRGRAAIGPRRCDGSRERPICV